MFVEEKYVPYFKTGKELRLRMNNDSETKSKVKSATESEEQEEETLNGSKALELQMRSLRYLILFLLAIVAVAFAVANRHLVRFVLDPIAGPDSTFSFEAPLFIYLFGALLIGLRHRRACGVDRTGPVAQRRQAPRP